MIAWFKENITGQTEDLTTQFYHLVPHVLKSQETLPLLDNLGWFLMLWIL